MRLKLQRKCRSWLAGAAWLLLPGVLTIPQAAQAQAVPLAERLQLCAGCHNPDGNSVIPENPNLSALDPDYMVRQLQDFKSGARKSPIMSSIIPMVDEKEFPALAEFFSKQKPKPGRKVDVKLAAQGKEIYDEGVVGSAVPACSGCHNDDGSGTEKYPRIAGQHSTYVIQQLLIFKSGERANDVKAVMRAVAKRMNEKEIRAVAEYVVTLKGAQE
jgi:cytochrome c553